MFRTWYHRAGTTCAPSTTSGRTEKVGCGSWARARTPSLSWSYVAAAGSTSSPTGAPTWPGRCTRGRSTPTPAASPARGTAASSASTTARSATDRRPRRCTPSTCAWMAAGCWCGSRAPAEPELDDLGLDPAAAQPLVVVVALVLEAVGRRVELREEGVELVPRRLALGVEPLDVVHAPLPEHRCEHVVVVDAQVVDAGECDLDRLAGEVLDAAAGHLEGLHDLGDGAHRLVRRDLQGGTQQVPVEEHVQVLVGRDTGQQLVGDRILGDLAGVAVRDPGGPLLEGEVGQRR